MNNDKKKKMIENIETERKKISRTDGKTDLANILRRVTTTGKELLTITDDIKKCDDVLINLPNDRLTTITILICRVIE